MKKYFIRLAVGSLAFTLGIWLVASYFQNNVVDKSSEIDKYEEQAETVVDISKDTEKRKFTFGKQSGGVSIDEVTKERVSFMSFLSSDGQSIEVNHFYVGNSYQKEYLRFKKKLKKASKVIEISFIKDEQGRKTGERALFQEGDKVKILKLFKVDEKEYYSPFEFYEIVAPNLAYALAFENRNN